MSSPIILDPDSGRALPADANRIAQLIHDYDPTLELAWVPPETRALNEAEPYAIIHRPPNAEPYIVMRIRETELDHRVIAKLWYNDNQNGNVLNKIEAEEDAIRALELLKQEEAIEEAKEKAAWMVKAPVGAKIDGIRLT
jgi:hypothetical protein